MQLKRKFNPEEIEAWRSAQAAFDAAIEAWDPNGETPAPLAPKEPKPIGVKLLTKLGPRWNLSPNLIKKGQREGWLRVEGDFVILTLLTDTGTEEVKYQVEFEPGSYCCHCGAQIEDYNPFPGVDGLTVGQRHVKDFHPGKESPDRNNPAGYRVINHTECVRV